MAERQRVYLLYHFFHPDDVISARLYSELGESLVAAGHSVIALPSNRSCHDPKLRLPKSESHRGVKIHRVWRPALRQAGSIGRILNSFFMLLGWAWCALSYRRQTGTQETVVIGTDPVFGILASIPWRLLRPRSKIIHWCHDVHPEAAIADGTVRQNSLPILALRRVLRLAYRRCDMVIDLGECMRRLLATAGGWTCDQDVKSAGPVLATITPWSLVEPSQVSPICEETRRALFGAARLTLLYSGNLGRAHDVASLLAVARSCRRHSIGFCFAGRGPGMDTLKSSLNQDDDNISMAGFASEAELQRRLSACDIHMVSLKKAWTGTVVPSKFFGALAIGRPVLFSGSADSSLATYISKYQIGWHLLPENIEQIVAQLILTSENTDDLHGMHTKCWQAYREHFSRDVQLAKWRKLINSANEMN